MHETLATDELGGQQTISLERLPGPSQPWFRIGAPIPKPLLEQIGGRVQLLCVVAVAMFAAHMLVRLLANPYYFPLPQRPVVQFLSWLGFTLAVGCVGLAARRRWLTPRTLIDVALVMEVVAAFFIVLGDHQVAWVPFDPIRGISWVCVWIIAFHIMVPAPAGRATLAAFAAAAMGPLALLLSVARGNALPPAPFMFGLFLPNFAAAGAAVIVNAIGLRMLGEVERERQLGSYTLVRKLGVGGMGEVWLARHSLLPRPAAVKVVRPAALQGSSIEAHAAITRFCREAEATARLHSPHCVQLFDFGTTRHGAFFYVMEYLDGIDLRALMHEFGPQSAERTIFLLRQACHALAEAHSTGLIHRDVKPGNIYICRHGLECDYVKLLDFGLVKALAPGGEAALTEAGTMTGTPSYLAPETLLSAGNVDHRVDIYALGCVAHALLTGQAPFRGEGKFNVALQHLREEPTAPSALTELDVPRELDRLILDCMAKGPEDRPASMVEVRARLESIPIAEPWTYTRAEEWWRLHLPARETPEPAAAVPA